MAIEPKGWPSVARSWQTRSSRQRTERKNRPRPNRTRSRSSALPGMRRSCGSSPTFLVAANGLGPSPRRFGAILHERRCDDPAHSHGSRPFHYANHRRRSKRLEPCRSPSADQKLLARTSSPCKPRFAVGRSPNPSCPTRVASRSDESALAPYTKPIAPPANLPATSFNPASMRSAALCSQCCAADLTEASRFPEARQSDSTLLFGGQRWTAMRFGMTSGGG
jgi:hypothetical protein